MADLWPDIITPSLQSREVAKQEAPRKAVPHRSEHTSLTCKIIRLGVFNAISLSLTHHGHCSPLGHCSHLLGQGHHHRCPSSQPQPHLPPENPHRHHPHYRHHH